MPPSKLFRSMLAAALITALFTIGDSAARAQALVPPAIPAPTAPGDATLPGAKIKVALRSDLPAHLYPITGKASDLVQDPAQVLALAALVKADINADLAKYDIADAPTLRSYHSLLSVIALLEKDYPSALSESAKVRDLTDKPADKLVSGLTTSALVAALQGPEADFHTTLRTGLEKALASVPYNQVQDQFKQRKGVFEILSPNLILGQVAATADPAAQSGKISQDVAFELINSAFTLETVIPNKADYLAAYSAVIDAHATAQKPDIWKARDVALPPSNRLHPVVVGIWDSGTDISLYPKNLWTNPNAGHDGYAHDLHGIAFTLHDDYSADLLNPWSGDPSDKLRYENDLTGFEDLQSNIDSPDADAVKADLSKLPRDGVRPFLEGLSQYGNYAHGTHVTGIAVRGNPAARVLVCRITFDYHLKPITPTIALAKKDAAAQAASVAYFKAHGVRVVNMSWGGDLKSVEDALEVNNAGGTPDERKKLARRIFEIGYHGLYDAIKNAPGILFVPAAGNGNDDVNFDEVLPSSFKLPNILVVGAVDQAGDQTSFTSFGNVDVYADGFQVPSYVPGGKIAKLSGTSMAAPQVTNLAAKLFALDPLMTPVQAKQLIILSADRMTVNGKTILLINPKKTLSPFMRADRTPLANVRSF